MVDIISLSFYFLPYVPHDEKTCFLHMQKQGADQLHGNRAADQRLCFLYIDN